MGCCVRVCEEAARIIKGVAKACCCSSTAPRQHAHTATQLTDDEHHDGLVLAAAG